LWGIALQCDCKRREARIQSVRVNTPPLSPDAIVQRAFGFWKVLLTAVDVFGLFMSLNVLIEFGEAFDYSGADFRGWCSEAGFERFEVADLASPSSAAIAKK
jgi:hypothetical protein